MTSVLIPIIDEQGKYHLTITKEEFEVIEKAVNRMTKQRDAVAARYKAANEHKASYQARPPRALRLQLVNPAPLTIPVPSPPIVQ